MKNLMGDEMEKSTKETTVQQKRPTKNRLVSCYDYANNPIKSIDLAVKGFGYRMSTSTRQHLKTKHCLQPFYFAYFQFLSSLFALLGFYGEVVHPAARPSAPFCQSQLSIASKKARN